MKTSPRSCDVCGAVNLAQARFCSACGQAMPDPRSHTYYTIEPDQDSEPSYWIYDETDPQLVRQTMEHPHPQGDDGNTPPYYLDQTTFWDLAMVKRASQLGRHFGPLT